MCISKLLFFFSLSLPNNLQKSIIKLICFTFYSRHNFNHTFILYLTYVQIMYSGGPVKELSNKESNKCTIFNFVSNHTNFQYILS